ncbi:roadblock/LC7 domain-containing protein [Nocardia barduliensis]|uniref:roadblock/LC7 domain-containing protein n=1 Tax=Nocardia barduliensis TaxID=2736643 RepID=UPI001573B3E9|nr:roadblock/LC7 domain-containing protein [Nocardia barduliensis]
MDDFSGANAVVGSLNWLLNDLVARLVGAEQAVVLSDDGLVIAQSVGIEREDAEHLAAMSSAFGSLARGVGAKFDKGLVHQTVVELEYGYLIVTAAGHGACLALLASEDSDLGMVAYEVNVIIEQVGDKLSALPRVRPGGLNV